MKTAGIGVQQISNVENEDWNTAYPWIFTAAKWKASKMFHRQIYMHNVTLIEPVANRIVIK